MNKSLFIAVMICGTLFADDIQEIAPDGRNIITAHDDGTQTMTTLHVQADYVEGEKSAELITPEVQAAATAMMGRSNAQAFLHAMRLNMLKYDSDMRSQTGRRSWHGRLIREEIYTNELFKVEVYSNEVDGTTWRYKLPFKPVRPKSTSRRVTYTTNGIPTRLATARAKRVAEIDAGTVVTNVETTANAPAETFDAPPPASH